MNKWTIPISLSLILHVSGFYFVMHNPDKPVIQKKNFFITIEGNYSSPVKKNTISHSVKPNNQVIDRNDSTKLQEEIHEKIEETLVQNNVLSENENIEASSGIVDVPEQKIYIPFERSEPITTYQNMLLYGDKLLPLLYLLKNEQKQFVFEVFIDKNHKAYDIKNIKNELPVEAIEYLKSLLYMKDEGSLIFDLNSGDYYENVCKINLDLDLMCRDYMRQRDEYTQQNASTGVGSIPH